MPKIVSNKHLEIPFYAKITICFVGLFALFSMLYITKFIVVPLIFAAFIAIILSPIVNYLVQKKVNKTIAIVLSILLTFLLLAGLAMIIFSQISQLSDSWPQLVDKFSALVNYAISEASERLHINPLKIHIWMAETKGELLNINSSVLGQTIVSVGSSIAVLFLIPVYVFLLISYQPTIIEFIHRLFGKSRELEVTKIVSQTKTVVQHYLVGLLIETGIVALLDIAVLLFLGIDYAILLGILGALLNLIPYLGGIVAIALPMAVAVATKSSAWYAAYVMVGYYIIQLIDNNYIVPKIVASKVKINALFSIIVVLAGNALWGISGMFLSIPLLAIVKLICDKIEPLKPYGFLLGNTMSSSKTIKPIAIKKVFQKIVE
jgi:predicted PurR-regulated permease PerM